MGFVPRPSNFSKEEMAQGIAFAHEHGVKVYVTVNILAHNYDLAGVREYLKELKELKPDALIIADPGIFTYAKEICPEIERHISTQANNTNYGTYQLLVQAWSEACGNCQRAFSGRDSARSVPIFQMIWRLRLSFTEQCVFPIPDAACLSNFLAGRDANQGACTHPCRWKYAIVEETRPG